MNSEFYKIGNKAGTDKIYHHGYHRFYDKYIKRDIKKLLEIGIDDCKSVNLWLQYCPEATIYGLDINKEFINGKLIVYKGDQSSTGDLEKLVSHTGNDIDVIIDDGSHIPEHQLFSFNKLFSHVKPGGVYIIEDIETSYWKKNGLYGYQTRYGKDHNMNIINIFRDVLHLLNREFMNIDDINQISSKCPISLDNIDAISSITFCQNCIIICRKELYEYQYVNRSYRFPNML
jgi:hypothetical protein